MSVTVNELKHQIDCAMGCSVCETCITNARLVDVFTGPSFNYEVQFPCRL